MSDKAFDRTITNERERPLSSDQNQALSQQDRVLRDMLQELCAPRFSTGIDLATTPTSGFIGDGFKVRAESPASMNVTVANGFGFLYNAGDVPAAIGGVVGLDDRSSYKPVYLSANEVIAVDAAPGAGNNRIDIIEVNYYRRAENLLSRAVLNVGTGVFAPLNIYKTLSFLLDGHSGRVVTPNPSTAAIGYKVGTAAAAGGEVAPATTAGYTKIAEIHVVGGVANIAANAVADYRRMLYAGGIGRASARWIQHVAAVPSGFQLSAPPGVLLTVQATSAFGGYIHLFTGAQPASVKCVMSAGEDAAGLFRAVTVRTPVIGQTVLADQTDLADAALQAQVLEVSVGQWWTKIQYAVWENAAGALPPASTASAINAMLEWSY